MKTRVYIDEGVRRLLMAVGALVMVSRADFVENEVGINQQFRAFLMGYTDL